MATDARESLAHAIATASYQGLTFRGQADAVLASVADAVRRSCTPSQEAYTAGGDRLVYAVADWIENPPEWVTFAQSITVEES